MADTTHSDTPSDSHNSRKARQVQASRNARDRVAAIAGNTLYPSAPAPSIYTNLIQGSPGTYNYDDREETASPICDDSDGDWLAGPPVPPLSLYPSGKMAVPLKHVHNWCALTHSAWKDEKGDVLPYHCVQEAHVVDQALSRQKVCLVLSLGLHAGSPHYPFFRKLNLR